MSGPKLTPAIAAFYVMLSAAIVVGLLTFHSTTLLRRSVETMADEATDPTKLESEWMDADGVTKHRVTTTREVGEIDAEHAVRHVAAVAAFKEALKQ